MHKFTGRSIVLTGGAGFIGSHIADALVAADVQRLRIVDNLATGHIYNIEHLLHLPQVEFIQADIRDTQAMQAICAEADTICHQAALGSVPRSIETPAISHDVNVNGFLSLLEAARLNGIQRFVYASSSSVYGDHPALPKREAEVGHVLSPYAATKKINELYAHVYSLQYQLKCIGFRYFNVFGPRQDPNGPYAAVIPKFIQALKNQQPIGVHGDGLQTRDFTFVANAVSANMLAMAQDLDSQAWNTVYNVAVGQNFSLLDLISELEITSGLKAEIVHLAARSGDIRNSLADIQHITHNLNYSPLVDFKTGLKITFEAAHQ